MKKHQSTIQLFYDKKVLEKWVTIKAIDWTGDHVTHNYGAISDNNKFFPTYKSRQCKCSPLLAAFIENNTEYKIKPTGPDPEAAILHLLRSCFIHSHLMFSGSWSPYQILLQSDLVIDKAFVWACTLATKWLGPLILPVGYIPEWPPPCPEDD